jgi:hypothetical protein
MGRYYENAVKYPWILIMTKTEFSFYADVDILGPYLPKDVSVINEHLEVVQLGLLKIPELFPVRSSLSASPESNEMVLTLEYIEAMYNSTKFYLLYTMKTPSGNAAYYEAVKRLDAFCSLLTLTVPGNRYYYKINALGMEPTSEFPIPFESPPSTSLFVASYAGSDNFLLEQSKFLSGVNKLVFEDGKLQQALESFSRGLLAEYRLGKEDDSAITAYYRVIELVGNTLGKSKSAEQKNEEYKDAVMQIKGVINDKLLTLSDKVKRFKEISTLIRRIEDDITNENIRNAGIRFKLGVVMMQRLNRAIHLRNKVVAHANSREKEISLEDSRDFRELAKMFLVNYIGQVHNMDIEVLNTVKGVDERADWYKSSYLNSHLHGKARDAGLAEG